MSLILNVMLTLLASAIPIACPRRPKPVISVQAFTPTSCITAEALSFKVFIERITSITSSGFIFSLFNAVVTTPVPTGFVRTSLSPSLAPAFVTTLLGCTRPVTDNPYFISLSSTEWPPIKRTPASFSLSVLPLIISSSIDRSSPAGKATIFMASFGIPPIA